MHIQKISSDFFMYKWIIFQCSMSVQNHAGKDSSVHAAHESIHLGVPAVSGCTANADNCHRSVCKTSQFSMLSSPIGNAAKWFMKLFVMYHETNHWWTRTTQVRNSSWLKISALQAWDGFALNAYNHEPLQKSSKLGVFLSPIIDTPNCKRFGGQWRLGFTSSWGICKCCGSSFFTHDT